MTSTKRTGGVLLFPSVYALLMEVLLAIIAILKLFFGFVHLTKAYDAVGLVLQIDLFLIF
jgi:hypothetical protein